MANSRSRKSAPTRPGTSRDQGGKSSATRLTSRTAGPADEPSDSPDDVTDSKATASNPTVKAVAAKAAPTKAAAAVKASGKKAAPAKVTAKKVAEARTGASSGSAGKRFGDGATGGGPAKKSVSTKSSGRGGRGGRPAPPVRVGPSKPWGMIAATVAVMLFAVAAIGYAVYQANSTSIPDSPEDIQGITTAEYASQDHVAEEQTYPESPPVGGLHDPEWADCDGAIYDLQIRDENAVHSLEHGAVWITYNPDDISDADLAVLGEYVTNQPHIFLSPYPGLSSLVSLQSWNHQIFADAVDDPRINDFIQVLRQNPATHPEVGASCTSPTFLSDPLAEGEPSRGAVDPGAVPPPGVPPPPVATP